MCERHKRESEMLQYRHKQKVRQSRLNDVTLPLRTERVQVGSMPTCALSVRRESMIQYRDVRFFHKLQIFIQNLIQPSYKQTQEK